MNLGNGIKTLRKSKGINQKELAKLCSISANALCQIELDNAYPSKETIKKVCKSLDVPVSYLLFCSIENEDLPSDKIDAFNILAPAIKNLLLNK